MHNDKVNVVIVSGLSGAGKTVVLRALEDNGYFCIDNLPVGLIEQFLFSVKTREDIRKVGIGVDIREKGFLADVYEILHLLKQHYHIEILFLEAEDDVMIRRYKETRRPHPMASLSGEVNLERAIEKERVILSAIRDAADRILDTSNFTPHQLRSLIRTEYGDGTSTQRMTVTMMSFGFKFGVPQNLDLLFDVRFLPNPYFIPDLKPQKGTDTAVSDFVLNNDETKEFLSRLTALLDFLLPRYINEGRTYLVIGVGCTGGRHRSPAIVLKMAEHIMERHGLQPDIIHRDMQ